MIKNVVLIKMRMTECLSLFLVYYVVLTLSHDDIIISNNNILGEITYNEFPTANGNAFVSF